MTYDQMSDNDPLSYTNSLVTIMVVINHRNIPRGPRCLQRVTPTPPPLLLISWRPVRLGVSFSVTPLTTSGTAASTSLLVVFHVVFDEADFPFSTASTPASDLELESGGG